MDRSGIDNILEQLNAASALASGIKKPSENNEAADVDFSQTLKAAIDKVNDVQQTAGQLSRDFVNGESNTDLHDVMISLQKANVSFQSMVQVRNKLVTAYQEIMNMQV
ncbi:MAG: flagellar hook-basal body complex protein FliE [Burkholderiales bacterium]|uniref:flagellar hook-basal body complex protein FliE n=1 Tax=Nitrosomonas sp. TaxID=42353 RepID=UPI001D5057AB|nr:flagellar hook-basal body complex protein FliE [Nitrosomonas sp.]MCB1947920.1 flagellar hook-basal body complex protein FliE [Nitrosomonas sp.]MCP5244180.1 flagellar hook-basal body complex protein FliE [Burkholderiales bacterium]